VLGQKRNDGTEVAVVDYDVRSPADTLVPRANGDGQTRLGEQIHVGWPVADG
jgi:hypothetical protein